MLIPFHTLGYAEHGSCLVHERQLGSVLTVEFEPCTIELDGRCNCKKKKLSSKMHYIFIYISTSLL